MERRTIISAEQLPSGEFAGHWSVKTSEPVNDKPGFLLHPVLMKKLVGGLNPSLFMSFEYIDSEILFNFIPEGTVLGNTAKTVTGKNTHVDLLSLALKPTPEFREEIRKQARVHAEQVATSAAPGS